jgi:three-Cys-motif partner protein
VRRQWVEEYGLAASYIDPFCGPGRVQEQSSGNFLDGSPLLAWDTSQRLFGARDTHFTDVILGDSNEELVDHAATRLREVGANVHTFPGAAEDTVESIAAALRPGFHFAFLDPYALAPLPFSVIKRLAEVDHLDMLIHFSEYDLRLNLDFNVTGAHKNLDRFCPRWHERYEEKESKENIRRAIRELWCEMIGDLGKPVRGARGVTKGTNVQYWLFLFSGNKLAGRFWDEMLRSGDQLTFVIDR